MESLSNSVGYDLHNNYGISLGDSIALMLPRNYHYVELALALNKIGAVIVPIDSQFLSKRIQHMLNISNSEYIITTREFPIKNDFEVKVIYIEDLKRQFSEEIECAASGEELFSIMFTSGTTGIPKGVMITNKQIIKEAMNLKKNY